MWYAVAELQIFSWYSSVHCRAFLQILPLGSHAESSFLNNESDSYRPTNRHFSRRENNDRKTSFPMRNLHVIPGNGPSPHCVELSTRVMPHDVGQQLGQARLFLFGVAIPCIRSGVLGAHTSSSDPTVPIVALVVYPGLPTEADTSVPGVQHPTLLKLSDPPRSQFLSQPG
ncbi:hypothetical protein VTK56DRAFT_3075 [Thermocarpiscus australiensis]